MRLEHPGNDNPNRSDREVDIFTALLAILDFVDNEMPKLGSIAELRTALVIWRQTHGWGKLTDSIGIAQLAKQTATDAKAIQRALSGKRPGGKINTPLAEKIGIIRQQDLDEAGDLARTRYTWPINERVRAKLENAAQTRAAANGGGGVQVTPTRGVQVTPTSGGKIAPTQSITPESATPQSAMASASVVGFGSLTNGERTTGDASQKAAMRSQAESRAFSGPQKTEHSKADGQADAPAKPAGEENPLGGDSGEEKPSHQGKKQNPIEVAASSQEVSGTGQHAKPWTDLGVSSLQKWLSGFMDGEQPPAKLVNWIVGDLAPKYSLSAEAIGDALAAARARRASPRKKNAPRTWNWFYETLRNAFIPGYEARLPEAPAAVPGHFRQPTATPAVPDVTAGLEALELPDEPDSLVVSYTCKCGAEIRQYVGRVVGNCRCGRRRRQPTRIQPGQAGPVNKRAAAAGCLQ